MPKAVLSKLGAASRLLGPNAFDSDTPKTGCLIIFPVPGVAEVVLAVPFPVVVAVGGFVVVVEEKMSYIITGCKA